MPTGELVPRPNAEGFNPRKRHVLIGGGGANEQGFLAVWVRLGDGASKFVNQQMGMMMADATR
jgi:hypothetical protein